MRGLYLRTTDDIYNIYLQIPNFIFCKDVHSNYMSCNMNLAQAAGLSSCNEIVGKTDYELLWSDYAASYQQSDEEILCGAVAQSQNVEPWLTHNGENIPIIVNKKVLFYNQLLLKVMIRL